MNEADMHCYLWPTSGIVSLLRGMDGPLDATANVQMRLSVPSSGQKAEQEPRPAARAASPMPLPWLAPGAGNLQHVPPLPTQPPRQPAITRPPPRPLNGVPCHEKALSSGRCTAHMALHKCVPGSFTKCALDCVWVCVQGLS